MLLSKPLPGNKLTLKSLGAAHATTRYLSWMHDARVTAYLESRFSPPQSTADLERFIADTNASTHSLLLGIFDGGDQHVGNIKLGPIDRHHRVGDIGILIGEPSSWGKGYASEAIALMSAHAFSALSLAKLTAGCYDVNEGSTRAFLRAGFVVEGRRRLQWQVGEGRMDGILLGRVNPALMIGALP
jgi:[ribosomal protein S5]-alanine N-acetyltransferase